MTTFADWLNIGASGTRDPDKDGYHPSGISPRIRKDGIYKTVIDRAEQAAKLGIEEVVLWIPTGVRKDLWPEGKLRWWYENEDPDWASNLQRAIGYAWEILRVRVTLYLGKIGMASRREFVAGMDLLASMPNPRVIIDNLSEDAKPGERKRDLDDPLAMDRITELRCRMPGVEIGSEFPESEPVVSDFGVAVDMPPKPTDGAPRGASLAIRNGAIPNGQPIGIKLMNGWPEGFEGRLKFWESKISDLTVYVNLDNEAAQAFALSAMAAQGA